jgi:cytochrome c peroxidase
MTSIDPETAMSMKTFHPAHLALVAGMLAAAVGAQAAAPHGATAFAAQRQALAALAPASGTEAPAGVDAAFWSVFAPEPVTPAQVRLGERLFFEPLLSRDGTVACATCHDAARSFTDLRPVSEGIGGKLGRRNAPTVMNAALIEPLFWDGRSPTLAHQAGQPILNPIEMGMPDRDSVVAKLAATEDYPAAFQSAFGRAVSYADIERAIAAFQRTLIFLDAPFDRFLAGDQNAISPAARKGHELFNGKARCAACHPLNRTSPLGTDYRFHNIGVSAHDKDFEKLASEALAALRGDGSEATLDRLALATDLSELGRFMVTKNAADIGSFRTPQLRNVGITPPYMHDGSMHTLWDVMDHYNKGGEVNAYLDGGIEALALSEEEIDQVVAFMFALTDRRFDAKNRDQERAQRERAAGQRPFRDTESALRRKLGFEDRVKGDKR